MAHTISAFDPAVGQAIDPKDTITFTVDDGATHLLGVLFVFASFAGQNTRELVWDYINGFNGGYQGAANQAVVTGSPATKYVFTVLRDGGWPYDTTLSVYSMDSAGDLVVA